MGFTDKIKELVGIAEEDVGGEELEGMLNDSSNEVFDNKAATVTPARKNNKVVNIHATAQLQVILVKPERFTSDAKVVADHLREKKTVILNCETTDKVEAARLIDFLAGVAYANDGNIKKIANNNYIITPYNVNISGDFIDELESNGMFF